MYQQKTEKTEFRLFKIAEQNIFLMLLLIYNSPCLYWISLKLNDDINLIISTIKCLMMLKFNKIMLVFY